MNRPVYPTHQGAQSAAISAALKLSASDRVVFVRFSGASLRERAVQPFEGGPAFAVKMLTEGWELEELDAAELQRRVVAGRRRAIDELLGSKFAERHHKEARRLVLEAEDLLTDEAPCATADDARVA